MRSAMKKLGLISALFLAPAGGARGDDLKRAEFAQPHMGTVFRIVLYADGDQQARKAAQAAFDRIARLDQVMSDYKEDSELMRLCRQAGGPPVETSGDLYRVLEASQRFSGDSGGAFDVTVGPLVRLWRRSRRQMELPSEARLADAKDLVGYRRLVLDPKGQTVQLLKKGMLLDLGGIAKGFAADEAQVVLKAHGVTQALVAAGGDIVVSNPPPGAEAWKIGVAPMESPDKPPSRFLFLKNAAVSTSGDAEQFVEIKGVRYSHIIDPRTGLGLTRRSSVTVVAPCGTVSDALATAVSVLGPEKGLELIDRTPGTAALVQFMTAAGIQETVSAAWKNIRQERSVPPG